MRAHVRYVKSESAKSRGLRGNVVTWVCGLRWSKFCVGYLGYVGLNIFYVGQHFTWVIIFMWVEWVKYIFAWVKFFCVGLCVGHIFLRGAIFGGRRSKENLDWGFHDNILVAH